jgi:predicted acylesterase/phospholipase RssA
VFASLEVVTMDMQTNGDQVPGGPGHDESYRNPTLECDLVMKGGVTSGVVYPSALSVLAKRYRFHSIGGTSAGAIAAAGAAAAEYGRLSGGFERLGDLQRRISEAGFLEKTLFEPTTEMRPVMQTFFGLRDRLMPAPGAEGQPQKKFSLWSFIPQLTSSLMGNGSGGFGRGALWGIVIAIAAALILSALLFGLSALLGAGFNLAAIVVPAVILALVLGVALWWIGGIVGGVSDLGTRVIKGMPANYYGLVRGHKSGPESEVLTDWLCKQIDGIAGKSDGRPLLFGDLTEREINLNMVTTNVSQGQPFVFPREATLLLFNETQWHDLFPKYVIDYLKGAVPSPDFRGISLPPGYHILPTYDLMPVVVPMRMSLSLPIVISAIPVYTIKSTAWGRVRREMAARPGQAASFDPGQDFQINWFSDGGACSNFPIHFFDSWLPTRPTFGINLTSLPEEGGSFTSAVEAGGGTSEAEAADAPSAPDTRDPAPAEIPRVFLPRPGDLVRAEWKPITGLSGFVLEIFRTAQNYRDNMQAHLPSYRERVVQVRLKPNEGGLNLSMPPEIINGLIRLGEQAAGLLMPQTGSFNFEHHRWVRLRVLMDQLEERFAQLEERLDEGDLKKLLEAQQQQNFPYERSKEWSDFAQKRFIADLRLLVRAWKAAEEEWEEGQASKSPFFSHQSPKPRPVMRVVPEL